MAHTWSATQPRAAITVRPGLMRVSDGKRMPTPPHRSTMAVVYRNSGGTCPAHGIIAASLATGVKIFHKAVPVKTRDRSPWTPHKPTRRVCDGLAPSAGRARESVIAIFRAVDRYHGLGSDERPSTEMT